MELNKHENEDEGMTKKKMIASIALFFPMQASTCRYV